MSIEGPQEYPKDPRWEWLCPTCLNPYKDHGGGDGSPLACPTRAFDLEPRNCTACGEKLSDCLGGDACIELMEMEG